ncbi:MAG: TRAP transporter small permease [Rectinema sp.]|jgi:TRAP-type C4-dicarboxylate transport system permease small subunit|uniref:Tripartite ATP-independent periplasmic transporter DctQ component n=1 Tax=uncultured spirochete TaxID=156406 RepID=A0A3P3XMQ7_9SPIR|nr:Tripartite ATP-independent periplasmic transporter DctQ component [uncultured spirochete]
MKKFLVSAVTLIHILLINLSMIMIVAMLLLVFANVVLRYVFNSGIYWSEEVALVLEVWFIFLSLGLGVKHRLHISINILKRESVSAWLNKALDLLSDIIFLIVGFVMIVYGGKLVQFTMRSIMPATKWPAGILYLVLPIAGFVVVVEALFHILGYNMFDEKIDKYLSGKGGKIRDIFRSES